jgi:NAD(P) transhydrogenase subunit alpha
MRIAIAREVDPIENRVAATPETVKKMKGLGADICVEPGAGTRSGIPDREFTAAGATITSDALKDSDVVLKVRRPTASEPATRQGHSSSP